MWFNDVEPLWVTGGALLLVLGVHLLLGRVPELSVKRRDWGLYLTLGTVFPLIVIALAPWPGVIPLVRRGQRIGRLALVLCALAAAITFLIGDHQIYVLFLSVIQIAMAWTMLRGSGSLHASAFVVASGVSVLAWMGAVRMIWWKTYPMLVFGSFYASLVLVAALAFVIAMMLAPSWREGKAVTVLRRASPVLLTPLFVLILLIASTRTTPSFNLNGGGEGDLPRSLYHHWGAIAGPAQVVQHGGWLLWDVPAQYGFLSTLAVAFFPGGNVWQSLYLIDAGCLFLSACFIFFVLRAARPGVANELFALIVALTGTFLVPGFTNQLIGPSSLPSIGAFRFIWSYLLLAVLIWEARAEAARAWYVPAVGSLVWLVGTFWSAESAAYCAAIWLPAYCLVVYRRYRAATTPHRVSPLAWLLLPLLLVVVAGSGISLWYWSRLGHTPDWRMFAESVSDYSVGAFAIPVNIRGGVAGLFVVFCAASTFTAGWMRKGLTHRALPLAIGAWGALWAASSYYIGRSAESNITNLAAPISAVIAVILLMLAREGSAVTGSLIVRMALIPVLVVQLTFAFGDFGNLRIYLLSDQKGYRGRMEEILPAMNDAQARLLDRAGVAPSDPVVLFDTVEYLVLPPRKIATRDADLGDSASPIPQATNDLDNTRAVPYDHTWLSIMPMIPLVTLPPERDKLYLTRFAERTHRSGWLLQRKDQPYTANPVLASVLNRLYQRGAIFEDGPWQLVHFQYGGA